MSRIVLGGLDTLDLSAHLDPMFTEIYGVVGLFSVSGSNLGLGVSPAYKFHVDNGGTSGAKLFKFQGTGIFPLHGYSDSGGSGICNADPYTGGQMLYMRGNDLFAVYINGTSRLSVGTSAIYPSTDNALSAGTSAFRYSVVYAASGSINTSDAREKTLVRPLSAAEVAAASTLAREIGAYRFLAAVAQKGGAAREHIGMTVQRAIEVMEAHGLDPMAYGFICYDSWPERVVETPATYGSHESLVNDQGSPLQVVVEPARAETVPAGDRYSFRPDQLALFILRGMDARLAELEAKTA